MLDSKRQAFGVKQKHEREREKQEKKRWDKRQN